MFTSIQIYFAWNIPASKSVKAAASKKKLNSSPPLRPLHWAMCSSLEYNQSGYRIHHACCLSCLAVSPANIFSCTKKPSLLKVQPKHPAKLFSSQRFFFWISVSYGCCGFFVKYLEERTNLRSIRFKETALQRASKSSTALHQHLFLWPQCIVSWSLAKRGLAANTSESCPKGTLHNTIGPKSMRFIVRFPVETLWNLDRSDLITCDPQRAKSFYLASCASGFNPPGANESSKTLIESTSTAQQSGYWKGKAAFLGESLKMRIL